MPGVEHHYALDAAALIDKCRQLLSVIINFDHHRNKYFLDLDQVLLSVEQLIHFHLLALLERDQKELCQFSSLSQSMVDQTGESANITSSCSSGIIETARQLKVVSKQKQQQKRNLAIFQRQHQRSVSGGKIRPTVLNSHGYSCANKRNQQEVAVEGIVDINSSTVTNSDHSNLLRYDSNASLQVSKSKKDDEVPDFQTNFIVAGTGLSSTGQYPGDFSTSCGYYRQLPHSIGGLSMMGAQTLSVNRGLHLTRSTEDSLLFRLIVTLQLCFVRIEDADRISCGGRASAMLASRPQEPDYVTMVPPVPNDVAIAAADSYKCTAETTVSLNKNNRLLRTKLKKYRRRAIWAGVGTTVAGSLLYLIFDKGQKVSDSRRALLRGAGNGLVASVSTFAIRKGWLVLCMNARFSHSTNALEDWQHQWMSIQTVGNSARSAKKVNAGVDGDINNPDKQSKHFLEITAFRALKASLWHSQGAVRFGLIKWVMDTLYASVGTAIQATKKDKYSFPLPITAAAAASYYAVTGPGNKSAEVLSNFTDSADLIQNAWGVISLPAVKNFALQASRLLKGAAIAEKITICGVSCFVLSKDPCPTLAIALNRFQRNRRRRVSELDTILETLSNEPKRFQRHTCLRSNDFPKKDVIFHLTGGGFFAHTLAGDVPYLLDWSAVTGAVVICPEYALLPDHAFPAAIDQVVTIYLSIRRGNAAPLLGFQTDQIIVTGESTGGNLAAALCVKLCLGRSVKLGAFTAQRNMERLQKLRAPSPDLDTECICEAEKTSCINPPGEAECEDADDLSACRLPEAMLLCCPALNLSLDSSPSRIRGIHDPVLPGDLISTISGAYIPEHLGVSKTDPLASPYYTSDEVLQFFPNSLIYTSLEDPLLDDSVDFNTRLRRLGVESDLRAAHNMPHAYWGLSTAGFPEARQVQRECQEWLVKRLKRGSR